jgi:hypothetical protein
VLLLLDLSKSLADKVKVGTNGGEQSILELSQEAVSLLAWSIEQLGDPFAIAGFHSDTRHDVRYLHLKGYSERWGDVVKSRLAAMQAGYSTRMGAPCATPRTTSAAQKAEKKLLLVLTDGQPADVDVHDERLLIEDARKSVGNSTSKASSPTASASTARPTTTHRPGRRLPGRILLNKGYEVHGIKRRSSLFNTDRIDHLYQDPHEPGPQASSCTTATSPTRPA